jgi:hypothetical protein
VQPCALCVSFYPTGLFMKEGSMASRNNGLGSRKLFSGMNFPSSWRECI